MSQPRRMERNGHNDVGRGKSPGARKEKSAERLPERMPAPVLEEMDRLAEGSFVRAGGSGQRKRGLLSPALPHRCPGECASASGEGNGNPQRGQTGPVNQRTFPQQAPQIHGTGDSRTGGTAKPAERGEENLKNPEEGLSRPAFAFHGPGLSRQASLSGDKKPDLPGSYERTTSSGVF